MMAARPVGMGGVFSGGGSTEALAGALTGLTNRGNESAYLVLLSILVNVLYLNSLVSFQINLVRFNEWELRR